MSHAIIDELRALFAALAAERDSLRKAYENMTGAMHEQRRCHNIEYQRAEDLNRQLAACTASKEKAEAVHAELLSYLPKVPTQPYEKAMAQKIARLEAAAKVLEEALVTIECGLVTTQETAQYAGFKPKEIAKQALAAAAKLRRGE